jgi:hypothetical protein
MGLNDLSHRHPPREVADPGQRSAHYDASWLPSAARKGLHASGSPEASGP